MPKKTTPTPRSIEYRLLDDLKANPANPKDHAVDMIEASVDRFGYIDGAVIDARTGYIISGHGRTKTLRAIRDRGDSPPDGIRVDDQGRWLVPVQVGWASRNDAEAAAALVGLNRTTELGGWVDDSLLDILEQLSTDEDHGLEGVGFGTEDLDSLRERLEKIEPPDQTPPGSVTEPPEKDLPNVRDLVTLHHGDCLDVMRTMPDSSVDAIVTDPPYGLGFMGKAWDDLPPGEEWARECLRVLKPGGHLLAFGGSRTWHRLAVAVEDAGFEIRDGIAWLTGSGFPKSLNVGKDGRFCQCSGGVSDGGQGVEGVERRGTDRAVRALRRESQAIPQQGEAADAGLLFVQLPVESAQRDAGNESARLDREAGEAPVRGGQPCVEGRGDAPALEGELRPGADGSLPSAPRGDVTGERVCVAASAGHGGVGGPSADALGVRESQGSRHAEQRPVEPGAVPDESGSQARGGRPVCGGCGKPQVTGLGTALKPAFEPIVVGRKPLAGTVASNVLAHGTGALNIDATRVQYQSDADFASAHGGNSGSESRGSEFLSTVKARAQSENITAAGRWPANVVLDGSQAAELDAQSGELVGRNPGVIRRGAKSGTSIGGRDVYGTAAPYEAFVGYGDSGGASRFFPTFRYEAKAATSERPRVGDVAHPTVKPVELMRWLVRLVTPPGGVVLEPFAGSGTTLEACVLEGFACIGIEREDPYVDLICRRLGVTRESITIPGHEPALSEK